MLGDLGDESHPDWAPLQSGLLVLRLVDGWLEDGARGAPVTSWGIRALLANLRAIPRAHPARRPLRRVVRAIRTARRRRSPNPCPIARWLLAYARTLDADGWPTLAIDVYQTIAGHLNILPPHCTRTHDLLLQTNLRLGSAARSIGDLAQATLAYERAATLAAVLGDIVGALRAEAGTASLTTAEAARHGRDRLRLALAMFFFELGVTTSARDGFFLLAATADLPYIRWLATRALAAPPLGPSRWSWSPASDRLDRIAAGAV